MFTASGPRRVFPLLVLAAGLTLFPACGREEPAPDISPELLADINAQALEIFSSSPIEGDTKGNADLLPLNDLGQARIVGLGEATHGTREFFEMKHRIFKYLVENFGFRAFAFECDFGESIYIDRWINGGPGDITELMITKMVFWTWKTAEVRALLEWMRAFNATRQESERIHYIGADCQMLRYQPALLREYLGKVSPSYLAQAEPLLSDVESHADDIAGTLDEASFNALMAELERFSLDFGAREAEFVPLSSKWEFDLAKHLIRTMPQAVDTDYSYSKGSLWKREGYMAENALWALSLFGEQGKIALWAHDGHVGAKPNVTGAYLKASLGDRYKTVGTAFSRGYFIARSPELSICDINLSSEPIPGSLNRALHRADLKRFFIRLDRLPGDSALRGFLATPVPFLMIGSNYEDSWSSTMYEKLRVLEVFDVIAYFDASNYAINFILFPDACGPQP